MKGTVKCYAPEKKFGQILGEDAHIYNFTCTDRNNSHDSIQSGSQVSFRSDGSVAREVSPISTVQKRKNPGYKPRRYEKQRNTSADHRPRTTTVESDKLPYDFVSVDIKKSVTDAPVFHDGDNEDQDKLISGELRCSLTALTPLLVAHDQYNAKDVLGSEENNPGEDNSDILLPDGWGISYPIAEDKSILEPLRLDGRVLIPGSSLNGMLRHSLGALLSAPMERVAERSYSYRPNLGFERSLESRAAVVVSSPNASSAGLVVNLLKLGYRPRSLNNMVNRKPNAKSGHKICRYYGGLDGQGLLAKRSTHHWVSVDKSKFDVAKQNVSVSIVKQYYRTLEHLSDTDAGHISSRHPKVKKANHKQLKQAFKALKSQSLQPGNLIYVEWDKGSKAVTSMGHNFQYRWRYTDTVRNRWAGMAGKEEVRAILSPLEREKSVKDADDKHSPPQQLSGARLFFGYASSDKKDSGTKDIGRGDFTRLAGRISCNIAVETPRNGEGMSRFVDDGKAVPLKALGMPRPSAVENYLIQPDKNSALQVTYGDLPGEGGGALRGRKFYRHQPDAASNPGCYKTGDSSEIKSNQAALARFVLKPNAEFKFTLRFRDLREWELGALLLALEPGRIRNLKNLPEAVQAMKEEAAKETDSDSGSPMFAHKIGHGRPLGLGSVLLKIEGMSCWNNSNGDPVMKKEDAENKAKQWIKVFDDEKLRGMVNGNSKLDFLKKWLEVQRYRDQPRCDYPREQGQIFTFHTNKRRAHAKARRTRR